MDNPRSHQPQMLLAATLMKRQKLDEAQMSFAVAASIDPQDRSTLTGLGDVSKDDGFCIKNKEFCIKNEELCI